MTSFVAKKMAKQALGPRVEQYFVSQDPYYEHTEILDKRGRPTGKTKKRRRPLPPGLTRKEEKVLKRVTQRARWLDAAINLCGFKVGWSALIGIIPAAGDVVDSAMALLLVRTCEQVDLPANIKTRMLINIVIDFVIGIVPFIGDIADAAFRANTRNAALLYSTLEARGERRIAEEEKKGRPGQVPDNTSLPGRVLESDSSRDASPHQDYGPRPARPAKSPHRSRSGRRAHNGTGGGAGGDDIRPAPRAHTAPDRRDTHEIAEKVQAPHYQPQHAPSRGSPTGSGSPPGVQRSSSGRRHGNAPGGRREERREAPKNTSWTARFFGGGGASEPPRGRHGADEDIEMDAGRR